MTTYLDDLATTVASIATSVTPGVVRLGGWRGANGVVIGPGQVLTNAHNVHRGPVTATFADGRTAEATLAGLDADGDLAVLQVDTGDIAALPWSDGASPPSAAPCSRSRARTPGPRVTFGLVSGVARPFRGPRGRRIAGSIEHTAPMGRGSSGSALVDAAGRLVGLNTNRLEGGLYLALPTDAALRARVTAAGPGRGTIDPAPGRRHRAEPCRAADAPGGRAAGARRPAGPGRRSGRHRGARRHRHGRPHRGRGWQAGARRRRARGRPRGRPGHDRTDRAAGRRRARRRGRRCS